MISLSMASQIVQSIKVYGGETDLKSINNTGRRVIAIDVTGKYYELNELQNKRICLYYKGTDGRDYYFAGQYNENNHWNGECLINSYKDGKLMLASSDIYDDGKKMSYIQLISSDDWIYGNRNIEKSGLHSGDTFLYTKSREIYCSADENKPMESDMIEPNKARNLLGECPRLWYHGCTNGKEFSDVSGQAFQVVFHEDGTVKNFYWGNFGNGPCFGWELARDEMSWRFYVEYVGTFSDNNHYLNESVTENGRYYYEDEILERIKQFDGEGIEDLDWGIDQNSN